MNEYHVGDIVRVQLSDAPEFTATITVIQADGYMKIEWANNRWAWITSRRIVK